MSSGSSFHPPPHLHRVSLHSHGKRPFEECGGYDSDPDNTMPTSSGTSSSSSSSSSNAHRFPSPSGTHNPEARNKRARSTSSSSTDVSSNRSSTGYNTAQSSSRSDLSSDDVHMSDLHLPMPPPQSNHNRIPSPPVPEDTLRTSLQRFAEFDRQIAALRTSLAATRSPPLPPLGPSLPSVDGDLAPSNDPWHSNPSNFLPNATSTTIDLAPPSDTPNSFNDNANVSVSASTASGTIPSSSFTPTFSNIPRYPPYPSYRPSTGGSPSHVAHEHMGDSFSSSSALAVIRPTNENTTRVGARSSTLVETYSPYSTSHVRRVRDSLSPLVFPSDPSSFSPPSVVADEILLRSRTLNDVGDSANSQSQRSADDPVTNQERRISSPRPDGRLGEQPRRSSQNRFGDRVRVIREHSVEREPVPSVFDVFSIGESSQDWSRNREPSASRFASMTEPAPPRALGTHDDRSRGPAPMTTAANANPGSQDTYSRLNSSWASIPSSNSLMSESASERRHALALERFRARSRRSSFDADDESDYRWLRDSPAERERENGRGPSIASPVPPSLSVENISRAGTATHPPAFGISTTRASQPTTSRTEPAASTPLHRSFLELFSETHGIASEERAGAWLLDWDASRVTEQERSVREQERERQLDRQRERTWEWERHRERPGQDIRSRSSVSGFTRTSTSAAREESSHAFTSTATGPSRPSLGQPVGGPNTTPQNMATTTTTTNNTQQYSYSNLNLSSFQSGLFRDSLRRNAEVDQASFSSAPVIASANTGESRAASRLGHEDSESEMDLDDFLRTRPPSPEWSRRQPYAGRTPPPEYSPPPRNFSLRPGSFMRRGSVVRYDSPARSQHSNRNAFGEFVRQGTSGPTRPGSHESNLRPALAERTERDRFLPTRLLESFHRSHEDGRRNVSTATGQTFHPQPTYQNHPLTSGSNNVSRNERSEVIGGPRNAGGRPATTDISENRRGSLGLGGSIRSRLARFANAQSPTSTNGTHGTSESRPRLASHPIGARPQATEPHRRGSTFFGGAAVLEREGRSDVRGAPVWAGEPPVVSRDVPWRASSGPRGGFGSSASGSGSVREVVEVNRVEEQRSRLRALRQRFQLDRGGEGMRVFRPGVLRAAIGRRGNLGDYVPDELFDDSYEALLSLSSMLGEVRSKATPEEVIASLPTGTFKEWKRDDSETRCPICLEDYEPLDVVTKLIECPHWLHKNCLEQWLRTANTCPVCREEVKSSPKPAPARRCPYRDSSSPSETNRSSATGNSSRASQMNAPSNNGRPVSLAAIVFDRMMNDGRDNGESSQVTPGTRDLRSMFLERLRAQQQQMQQRAREVPHGQDVPFMRMPATGVRPMGFVSLARGQGSGTSISSSSSSNMVADDGGSRRPMVGTSGGPGPVFFDASTTQRRETLFPFVPPLPPSFEPQGHAHGPTVVITSSSEPSREWRGGVRAYDTLFNTEPSRSSSSGSSSSTHARPITSRIPIHEDSPSEEYMFRWNVGR